jgi:HAD superfamily hydrolase (TIGR01509 family)
MLKGVIWDLDGTIIDSQKIYRDAAAKILGLAGVPERDFDLERTLPLKPRDDAAYLRDICALYGRIFSEDEIAGLVKQWQTFKDPAVFRPELMPGAIYAVRLLQSLGIMQIIATNSPLSLAVPFLQGANSELSLFFKGFVLSAHDVGRPKPEPDVLLQAARVLDIVPSATCVIGDAGADIIAGQAAGMKTIYVPNMYSGNESPPANLCLRSLTDLSLQALDSL